jgi:mannosyltransferase OCH1-like enzyme
MIPFPKNMFQVWFQGCDKLTNQVYQQNITSWKMFNPDWSYKCMSETNLREECKKYSKDALDVFDSVQPMHVKIDLGRYITLYNMGGIYLDMDAYAFRPLRLSKDVTELIKIYETTGKHVLGLSCLNIDKAEAYLFVNKNVMLNNAIMMSSPFNPILKEYIDNVLKRYHQYSQDQSISNFWLIQQTTGPKYFNEYFHSSGIQSDATNTIHVFNHDVFEPCQKNKCNITDNTVAIHNMDMTWVNPTIKTIHDTYFNIKNNGLLLLVIIVVLTVLLLFFPRVKQHSKKF